MYFSSSTPFAYSVFDNVLSGNVDIPASMDLISKGMNDRDHTIFTGEHDLNPNIYKRFASKIEGNTTKLLKKCFEDKKRESEKGQTSVEYDKNEKPKPVASKIQYHESDEKDDNGLHYGQCKKMEIDPKNNKPVWHWYPCSGGYSLDLNMLGQQDLKQLKIDYPIFFGWLADTDTIYQSDVVLTFHEDGFVKGRILQVDRPGMVLYLHNGYQPNYQNEEYVNEDKIPVEFQFKGKKGDIRTFHFYTTRPLNKSYGRYSEIRFVSAYN